MSGNPFKDEIPVSEVPQRSDRILAEGLLQATTKALDYIHNHEPERAPDPLNLSLSYSMIAAWQACRYRWWLQYDQRYYSAAVSEPMDTGSAVHAALESVLRGGTVDEGLEQYKSQMLAKTIILEDFETVVADMVDDVITQARAIALRGIRDIDLSKWETCYIDGVPAIEMEFEAPVPGFKRYVGKVDWIAREVETGHVYLWEFKTRKTLQQEEAELFDQQKASYQYLLRRYGIDTAGSITFQMLTKAPKVPKTNKDGGIARSKLTTDWETYSEAVRAAGQDPRDYFDMKDKLTEFFRLTRSMRGHDEVTNVWEQIIVPVAQEIAVAHKNIYRTMNFFSCRNCTYREPCIAALRGYDASSILSRQFHQRKNSSSIA